MNEGMAEGTGMLATIVKGTIGGAGPMLLAVFSLPEVEQWARVLAFSAGFIVSVLTAINLIRTMRK